MRIGGIFAVVFIQAKSENHYDKSAHNETEMR